MATVKKFQTIIDSRSYFEGSYGDINLDKLAAIFFFRMMDEKRGKRSGSTKKSTDIRERIDRAGL